MPPASQSPLRKVLAVVAGGLVGVSAISACDRSAESNLDCCDDQIEQADESAETDGFENPALVSDAQILANTNYTIRPGTEEELVATGRMFSSNADISGDLVSTYVTLEESDADLPYSMELSDGTPVAVHPPAGPFDMNVIQYIDQDGRLVDFYSTDLDGRQLLDFIEGVETDEGDLSHTDAGWAEIGEMSTPDYADGGYVTSYDVSNGSVVISIFEPRGDVLTFFQFSPAAREIEVEVLGKMRKVIYIGLESGSSYSFQLDSGQIVQVEDLLAGAAMSRQDLREITEDLRIIEAPADG